MGDGRFIYFFHETIKKQHVFFPVFQGKKHMGPDLCGMVFHVSLSLNSHLCM